MRLGRMLRVAAACLAAPAARALAPAPRAGAACAVRRTASAWRGAPRAGSLARRCGPLAAAAGEPDRPPTLPAGSFRPKQSLGQNYLSDANYAAKIVNALAPADAGEGGARVVELGPGLGALTRLLLRDYPDMMCVELDGRAVTLLGERYPGLTVVEGDVLAVDYTEVARLRGGPLAIIGNLPYYITSQILFTLCDHAAAVDAAAVTMQYEVAQRLVAAPRTKAYGVLSVVFQLYATPRIAFKIPNTAFYPVPKVTSALVTLDFPEQPRAFPVDARKLRTVLTTAFRQRRKMLRQSLKSVLNGQPCPEAYATRRPEELAPEEFLDLTGLLFGFLDEPAPPPPGTAIWRTQKLRGAKDFKEKEPREPLEE